MNEIEHRRTRSNVSRIDRRSKSLCAHAPAESATERAIRMKIEADEVAHRHRREESDDAQRHWREQFITRSVVYCGLGICVLCAVILLLGRYMTPEVKEWAITTLRYGSMALVSYLGVASGKKGLLAMKGEKL
jgi:hypothetical protein